MHKVLFHIPLSEYWRNVLQINGITIYSYAFCVVLGAIIACWFIKKYVQNTLEVQLPISFFYKAFVAGFVGGKLLYYLEKPVYYLQNPTLLLNNFSGGFVCYGSVIAVSVFAVFYAKKNKFSILGFLDILSVFTVFPIAFGRLGCFLNGCCYGKPTESALGLVFPNTAPAAVHPTQLYEFVLMLFIFIALWYMQKHKKINGQVFILNLSLYAIGRSIIELVRGDERGFLFNHTISQAQCIACLAIIISAILFKTLQKKQTLQYSPLKNKS
jgi:phosphatidylglycerol---prolipoprotein diacylglyceryl transferase